MSGYLLDVNVLIALLDQAHVNHDAAHHWFSGRTGGRWATCPITENGLIRILSNPRYPNVDWMPADIVQHLRSFLLPELGHVFWPDRISLRDDKLFHHAFIVSHKQITDVYLLGLAVDRSGVLVTFDRSIPLPAVRGAGEEHVTVLS
jgi:toxin-antitoxin system PIN domain toxin